MTGQYGKPYFAYISPDGTAGKPFVLPQKIRNITIIHSNHTIFRSYPPHLYPSTPSTYIGYIRDMSNKTDSICSYFHFITIFAFVHTVLILHTMITEVFREKSPLSIKDSFILFERTKSSFTFPYTCPQCLGTQLCRKCKRCPAYCRRLGRNYRRKRPCTDHQYRTKTCLG